MRHKVANRRKNTHFKRDFDQLNGLFTELETSIESSLKEDEMEVFEALDTLEENLDDLSYLTENATHDDPLRNGNFLEAELPDALRILIAGFRPFKIDDFKAHCQNLINIHGFSKFREAFDALFLHDEHLNKREMRAIKHINRYLMNRMMDTFASITTEGSRTYAQSILEVLNKPDEFFRENALAAATKDKFQKAKKLAIKAIEAETAKQIAEIERQGLPKEEMEEAIEHVKKKSSKQITAIEQMETMPKELAIKAIEAETAKKIAEIEKKELSEEDIKKEIEQVQKESSEQIAAIEQMKPIPLDYYVEAERRKMLVEAQRARALFQSYDKVADFVLNDILAKKTMDERTVTVERYLLMAEKLVARKNFDAACQIYAAVQKTPVYRLAKTKEGLSTHTREVLEDLDKLFNKVVDLRARCEQDDAYLPLNFTVTDITFSTDEKNSFVLDSEGKIVKGCSGLAGMDKTIANCQKATTSTSYNPDYMLLDEIDRNQAELASKTQKEIDKEHDKISQELEPRGNAPESSPLLSKMKYKKLIRLGIVDPPKRSEQHHKLEELIHTLKHGIQTQLTRLKNFLVRTDPPTVSRTSSILEEIQDGVTSLFDKVSSFFHDKLRSLTPSSKFNREAFFQIKEKWSSINEDNEDREDEYLSL
ncbi:RasGEF domain-containing protein [Legionella bozemanae]|uniref:RasGEF domain protein n=1 Tax=Legionella bozemanae TaxID=447 RepID=A0A0W0RDG2_LEGBO|nr:RasGEF domain-containing protein [Legionella bozemanae]KTC69104.1 RasGEF domain protein [Legionella bozemanae]STO35596.1 RasGEF domain [Legionella bozemanae]